VKAMVIEVEVVEAIEVAVVDKTKMKKKLTTTTTTTTTMHVIEDAIMVKAVDQIDTVLIVIIMVNMVIMQVSVIKSQIRTHLSP
jgi:hypothetical protein